MWCTLLVALIGVHVVLTNDVDFLISTECPANCTCLNKTMTCDTLPENIPAHIESIQCIVNTSSLSKHMLNDTWQNIQKFEFKATGDLELGDSVFAAFRSLTHLRINVKGYFRLNLYSFDGLDLLVELNLADNGDLQFYNLISTLHVPGEIILPNLKILNIRGIQSAYTHSLILDSTFYDAVTADRNLTHLDISETNIGVFDFQTGRLCDSMTTLFAQNVTIATAVNFMSSGTCHSLRSLDISGAYLPILRHMISFQSVGFTCFGVIFYLNVENLLLNKMVNRQFSPILEFKQHFHLDLTTCAWNLKHISFRENSVRVVNMSVSLSTTLRQSIRFLDFSHNIIEYIKPEVISPSINIQFLDLSHNKLNKMQENQHVEFRILFRTLINLKYLNISHNGLTNLPVDIFQNTTHLEELYLNFNKMNAITFKFKNLVNLRILSIKSNNIHFLDVATCTKLDTFAGIIKTDVGLGNKQFSLDIHDNAFVCECDKKYTTFLHWILSTNVISTANGNYTCKMGAREMVIDSYSLESLNSECIMRIVKLVLAIVIPLLIFIVILSVLTYCMVKSWYKRKRTFSDTVSQIRKDTFRWKYLTFVSFCSEDESLVKEHILPQLTQAITQVTGTNRELVSTGDVHIRVGFPIRSELVECILNSAVIIIIVSNTYCEKQCCQIEAEESYNLNKPIVLIMLDKVDSHKMGKTLTKIFRQYTHASWVSDDSGGHLQPTVSHIVNAIITLAGNTRIYKDVKPSDIELQNI